jgi:hypothetical protein
VNAGWHAEANGEDLGDAQLVNGYANGWLVTPEGDGPIDITITWEPQRVVRVAVLLSVLAALLCVGIIAVALVRRRRRRAEGREAAGVVVSQAAGNVDADGFGYGTGATPILTSPLVAGGRTPGPLAVTATALLAGAAAAAIVRPWVGVVVGLAVLLVLLVPRARAVLALVPPVALMLCGLFVAWAQFRHDYPPQFEWPTGFWRIRNIGWLAILLLAADAVVGLVRKAEPPPDEEPVTPAS